MRRLTVLLLLVGAFALFAGHLVPCSVIGTQPDCYVALQPGPAENILPLIEVDGRRTYSSAGELLLTTVAVDTRQGFIEWVRGGLDPAVDLERRELLFPPELERREVTERNRALMQASQVEAEVVALRELGFQPTDGAEVVQIAERNALDRRQLRVGDVIVAVDGERVASNDEVVEAVQRHAIGDRVRFEIRRGGEVVRSVVTLIENPDAPGTPMVGVLVAPHIDLPFDVSIDAGRIGGPSAGLMFALSLVDLLGPDDLTGGAVIAGTGEIGADGVVGPIGGIQQKILGAIERTDGGRPAEVFLVPRENLEEARETPVGREVLLVPVDTFDDAMAALADLRAGRTPAEALALGG